MSTYYYPEACVLNLLFDNLKKNRYITKWIYKEHINTLDKTLGEYWFKNLFFNKLIYFIKYSIANMDGCCPSIK